MTEAAARRAPGAELQDVLDDVHRRCATDGSGALATYIPELANANPEAFGLAIATVSGDLCVSGDALEAFTIQSVSKAFTYCLAVELVGAEAVMRRVGVEPSGDAFNSIQFDPTTRRPYNPMVNAGAITVAGIIRDELGDGAFDHILARLSIAAGRRLDVDEAVYRSEAATGHRNRAISHLLLAAGVLSEPVEPIVDLYFRQCSIRVTAVDLAWMGASLANLGRHPVSRKEAFDLCSVRAALAVMYSCGMYDFSGNWGFNVGIPAKSGVGGGIVGVVNRQLGLGAFSPRLDPKGNSVRGVAAFAALSDELGLHAFDWSNIGSSVVKAYTRR